MGGVPDLRSLGINKKLEILARRIVKRLEYYDRMGQSLNKTLMDVSREFGTTITWIIIRGKIIVGQWYIIEKLRQKPEYLEELLRQRLLYRWRCRKLRGL
ncbi:MAG: hypothetical protein DRN15_11015 [Thermoprotei archaeon]|nr:MAG: hypothetical protein DRN15_11015 [Thermoprotei archaeon]